MLNIINWKSAEIFTKTFVLRINNKKALKNNEGF